ncbi:MAG: AsmA family protein [Kiritimatiellae bacterium]|nr:AsmA family protein [Kiritimatiellia bacterium]
MKKIVKILVGIFVVLLVVLLGAVLTLPLTIAPLVKGAAATFGPKVLGVDVSIGDVKLRPIAGQLTISDIKIGNPKGYSAKDAFAVKTIDINLKTVSLVKGDVIQIKKILIDAPEISYETKDGRSNFDTMLAKAQSAEKSEDEKTAKDSPDKKATKKVIIDEFVLTGSKVSYASSLTFNKPITLPLPPVKINDIGKASGGASMIEALNQVFGSIVGGLRDAITKLATGSTDAIKGVSKAATDALGNVAKGGSEAVGDISKKASDAAGSLGKGASDAAGAAGEAVKDTSKKLKGLFGK